MAGSGTATFLAKGATAATPSLRRFVDALPLPPTLAGAQLSLRIRKTTQKFHADLPLTPVWGYNGGGYNGYLGPTVEAVKGTRTSVSYVNELPAKHLFNVDPTITQMRGKPLNSRILTHLHGGHISPEADGNPFTSADVAPGGTQTVEYANDQEAAHIWYHDHALGITRLNVMAGLAGHYLLRDEVDDGRGGIFPSEPGTGLPHGRYEVPLAIQDRTFTSRGKLTYPAQWTPEFFGDVVTVNGKVWPYLRVEPRKYRFRILNGSNSRFYNLTPTGRATMTQIGTDGGLLPRPVPIDSLLIAPGERADVVMDFTGLGGSNVRLVDTALPDTTVSPATPLQRPDVMQFRVRGTATVADKPLPTRLRDAPFSVPGEVAQERFVTLEEVMAGPVPRAVLLNGMRFHEHPVTEKPRLGTTEVWTIVNLSADTHPIHLHLVQFEVLGRRALDATGYQAALDAARAAAGGPVDASGRLVNPDPEPFLGANEPVEANELGPKDTVRANPMQITRVRVNFDIAGGYVWHCHILEHEDNDMMRPFEVV